MKSSEIETSRTHHGDADWDRPVIKPLQIEGHTAGGPREMGETPAGIDGREPIDGTLAAEMPARARISPCATDPSRCGRRPHELLCGLEVVLRRVPAGLLLGLTLPLMLAAMAITVLTSRGPALYTQWRVGRGGLRFRIYKIRTMVQDSERGCGPRWASPDDPRITWAGRFLRRTHIDELPQFWNVIRGEMSLVGPRPERPEILEAIAREIPSCALRTIVTPGITGLAQILQGPDMDLESVRRKLACDLYYIAHRGFVLDCKILLATPFRMIGLPGPVLASLFRLPSLEDCRRFVAALEGRDLRRGDRPDGG